MKRIFNLACIAPLGALCLLVFGLAPDASADPIPAGWTCNGTCGTLGANGVVTLSPIGNSAYEFISTSGSTATAVLPGIAPTPGGETNGTVLSTPLFSASAGDALEFYFNFVTSDGAQFADYAWAELFDSSSNPVALLFTARTEPSGSIVPGAGLPPSVATLTPASVPIIPGGPTWSPLNGSSGACFSNGCGYTGWVLSSYTIPNAGNYFLGFGVTNWLDQEFDTGMAIDGTTIAGVPITPSVPEPSTLLLFGSGLVALAGVGRRRLHIR